ncbi:FHA domain-containing protein [uncultured Shewanella sp.]|uniref:type VI secretion system-associated FHA domain protein n=1 Tax=uncultured Shewanella sp. TaxID=173975 RepID=UPI002602DF4F|nr:FHA domain-containing protein [uncultured Shewanella sp.]
MGISFHVIVAPDAESLGCMSFNLPEEGGSIGRGESNSFMLPDETETISSVHALVRKENNEYILEDISQSGVVVNGAQKAVGYQNEVLIRDGDLLDIGAYRLLVSCFDPLLSKAKPLEKTLDKKVEDPFKNKINVRDREVVDRSDLQSYCDPFMQEADIKSEGISEDPQDMTINDLSNDVDNQVQVDPFIKPLKEAVSLKKKEDITLNFDDIDPDPFKNQVPASEFTFYEDQTYQDTYERAVDGSSSIDNQSEIDNSASFIANNQILSFPDIVEHQTQYAEGVVYSQNVPVSSNEQMKMQIDLALARFIDDLSPSQLEHMFNQYHSGLFNVKKKDMWPLYCNYFKRMAKTEEFRIKFWSYFHDSGTHPH